MRLRACLVVAFAIPIALAGAPRAAHAQSPNPGGRPVRAVEFDGLDRLSPHFLRSKIRTRVGEAFDAEVLSQDVARLYALGDFDAQAGITVGTSVDERGVTVVFRVTERQRINRIVIRGRDALGLDELADDMRSKKGQLLDHWLVEVDKEKLRKQYVDEGYVEVAVTHTVRDPARDGKPGEVDLIFDIQEGRRVLIDEILFDGVNAFDPDDIREIMLTKEAFFFGWIEKGNLDRELIAQDVERIAAWYRRQGYLDVRVYNDAPIFNEDRSEVDVTFHVQEGPRYLVRTLQITNVTIFDAAELEAEMTTKPGDHFDGTKLEADLRTLRSRYGQKSYVLARSRTNLTYDHEEKVVDISLDMDEGGPVTVERILIEGNDKTRDHVVRRELSIHPGEPFDSVLAEESLARLGRRRWFDDVRIRFEEGSSPETKDVILRVDESKTGSILLGGGISSNVGFFANIVYSQRNFDLFRLPRSLDDILDGYAFAGGGQSLLLQAQPGGDRSSYRANFTEPWFLGLPVVFSLDGFIFDRDFGDYVESRIGGLLGLGYRINQDVTVKLTYRLEEVQIHEVEFDAIPDVHRAAGKTLISSLRASFSVDRNLIDRTFLFYGGWGFTASYEWASEHLGSDLDFNKISAEANLQHTLFEFPNGYKHVFAIRGEIGWIEEYGNTDEIPIFERFFAGGARSIRGFEFRSVGPQFDDEPQGGNFITTATIEYNFPILPQNILRGLVFIDAGSVVKNIKKWELDDELELDGVRVTMGAGLRLFVPYFPAPVAFDFGFPVIKMDDDDEEVFSFTIGIGF